MTENLGNSKRTAYCGELRENGIGNTVSVAGWVQKQRDLGALIFIDLRDRSGIIQLAFDESTDKEIFEKAFALRSESVVFATGLVRERSSKNPALPTGNIEIYVTALKVLSVSETPPFEITDNTSVNEELRLKYRYLDLRRSVLTKNIIFRHKIAKITRDYFCENGFLEIETPMLIKSTPEGARDYLVPSRIRKGSFYALPQSPQLYKQLCMVAGFDRYFQLARCFRDEDLRADRQPEFTQIDLEMSFVEMDDVLNMVEGYIKRVFWESLNIEIPAIPRYTYKEVMERYGSDKPDLRFGMEIRDLTDTVKNCGFSVFSSAAAVLCINAEGLGTSITRKDIDRFTEYAKGCGAMGLAWLKQTDGVVSSSFSKFMTESEMAEIAKKSGLKDGDAVFIVAGSNRGKALSQMGQLRVHMANQLKIPKNGYNFLWVVEMPYFEYDEEAGEWVTMHHAFTAPLDECLEYLETDKSKVRAKAYDLVLNGIELSSGSIRITDPDLQSRIFRLLGLSDEEIAVKFGFLVDAFRYGAPPHGGMALGLDRLVMQMLGSQSLRDVVAFPKAQNAAELMTDCPGQAAENALEELGIIFKGDK